MNLKIVFTDSGLGGLTIMADFAKLAEYHNINVDLIYFNAQYSDDFGYKKMDGKTQVEVFTNALTSMQNLYKPDIIAIACNTLSVVYQRSEFSKQNKTKLIDIIKTGQSLINDNSNGSIIQVAMPTTIESGIYLNPNKKIVGVASDDSLPGTIESGNNQKIDRILETVFTQAKSEIDKRKLSNTDVSLFLGCTHFPIIADRFIEKAKDFGIQINTLLNPNAKFSQLLLNEVSKKTEQITKDTEKKPKKSIKVVSRLKFKDLEIKNISAIAEKQSPETAQALINYELKPDLF